MYKTTITDETGKTIFEASGRTILLVQPHEDEKGETEGCYGLALVDGTPPEIASALSALDHVKEGVLKKCREAAFLYAIMDAAGRPGEEMTDMSDLMRELLNRGDGNE